MLCVKYMGELLSSCFRLGSVKADTEVDCGVQDAGISPAKGREGSGLSRGRD